MVVSRYHRVAVIYYLPVVAMWTTHSLLGRNIITHLRQIERFILGIMCIFRLQGF